MCTLIATLKRNVGYSEIFLLKYLGFSASAYFDVFSGLMWISVDSDWGLG